MRQETPAGLYVHLPFCASRCSYCDFLSGFDPTAIPTYIDAVLQEAKLALETSSIWNQTIFDTIYLGGGTPSWLGASHLVKLIDGLRLRLPLNENCECTSECNPSDIAPDLLDALESSGVNRISLGVQSFVDKELRILGRRHDGSTARIALSMIRDHPARFLTSLDLMHNVPDQTLDSLNLSIEATLRFKPEHLSCYALTLIPGTPLAKWVAPRYLFESKGENDKIPDDSDSSLLHYQHVENRLEEAGFEHYEVSNYAKFNKRSRHNQKYWNRTRVLALGCGAHGFDGHLRYQNHRNLDDYLEDLRENRLPHSETESIDAVQARLEAISLGLRTSDGFELHWLRDPNESEVAGTSKAVLNQCIAEGLVTVTGGRVKPSKQGMLLADGLAARLA